MQCLRALHFVFYNMREEICQDKSCQLLPRRRIHRIPDSIPDFLCACCRRCNIKSVCEVSSGNHVFKNKFRHWGTADVAVADK